MEKVMTPTRTQVFAKRTLQQVLKDLRAHDYRVIKEDGGYRLDRDWEKVIKNV